jgi:hypothetical protein
MHQVVLKSIDAWLADRETHASRHGQLRWAALVALSETESAKVVQFVRKFNARGWAAWQALFRNGDLAGGLQLCLDVEPGVGASWRDRQIEHAKNRLGTNLRAAVDKLLRQTNNERPVRVGALRLAGYLADPQLAEAVEMSWNADPARSAHLKDYLWAAARCCGTNPDRILGAVCNAWGSGSAMKMSIDGSRPTKNAPPFAAGSSMHPTATEWLVLLPTQLSETPTENSSILRQ